MILRVLLIQAEPQDVIFLRDVLAEIESRQLWNTWVHIDALHAAGWDEAASLLADEAFDLILLDPDLADCQGIGTFRRVQAAAPHTPVVLLVEAADQSMALKMIREGAQDFLVKQEIDYAPLTHAIRTAIERHRVMTAARAGAIIDSLTGLPNRSGFLTWADRDRKLADRLGRRLLILLAEPDSLADITSAFADQRRDLVLVEAADYLRAVAGPTDLVARVGETRFGMAVFETDVESLEEAWARFHAAAQTHRISIGAAIFDGQRPASLDVLLEQASLYLVPHTLASATNRVSL